jgi:hypothetical protein
MRATAFTTIRWLRMTNVRDCKTNCQCSDKLRRILVKLPINKYDEVEIDSKIEKLEKKYKLCFNINSK